MTEESTAPDMLVRTFDVELAESEDGRTLEGLCVPFNRATTVADAPDYIPYQEMFVKGAFSRATKAPNRVYLNFEHKPGISNVLGHGLSFEERDDGLYGKLRVDEGPDGEKARRLYHEKVLTGLSVEFRPMGKSPNVNGVVERRNVHLDAVALCRQGAYPEAQVLAMRQQQLEDDAADEAAAPDPLPDFDHELAERLERFGIDVPEKLKETQTV